MPLVTAHKHSSSESTTKKQAALEAGEGVVAIQGIKSMLWEIDSTGTGDEPQPLSIITSSNIPTIF